MTTWKESHTQLDFTDFSLRFTLYSNNDDIVRMTVLDRTSKSPLVSFRLQRREFGLLFEVLRDIIAYVEDV